MGNAEVMEIASIPGLQELWGETLGDAEIRIAILHGPVDKTHSSLIGAKLTTIVKESQNQDIIGPALFHGTHVASVIFAQHGGTVQGIAPKCTGLLHKIFSDGSDARFQPSSQIQLADAIHLAIDAGAQIINISGGEPSPTGEAEPALKQAILECEKRGILVVAAAGNGDCSGLHVCECMHVPAALPTVLAVGAMNQTDSPLAFSNCGKGYAKHGILAPGAKIPGATPNNSTTHSTGTSYAAPVVTGVAALLLSMQKKLGLKPDGLAVREALLKSAVPCDPDQDTECERILAGRLNIPKAVSLIRKGTSPMNSEQELLPAGCGCQANTNEQPTKTDDDKAKREPVAKGLSTSGSTMTAIDVAWQQKPSESNRLTPSSCTNDSNGQLVYVIGNLTFDFGTTGNRESLQQNIHTPHDLPYNNPLQITDPFGLLAYLLGFRYKLKNHRYNKDNPTCGPEWYDGEVSGNLHDASNINWVLLQNNCPKYILNPQGAFEEAGYLELIRFLIEQCGYLPYLHKSGCNIDAPLSKDDHECQDLRDRVPSNWYCNYGDFQFQLLGYALQKYYSGHANAGDDCCPCIMHRQTSTSTESLGYSALRHSERALVFQVAREIATSFDLVLSHSEFIAIAGEICGTKRLLNGNTLRVISPAMRSSASWNMVELIMSLNIRKEESDKLMFILGMIQTLSESVLNDGISAEERALNYSSTNILSALSSLLDPKTPFYNIVSDPNPNGGDDRYIHIGFDGSTVEKSKCKDLDTLPYDVTLAFYNTNSLRPSRVFVTQTVNVADVNPVGQLPRVAIRR